MFKSSAKKKAVKAPKKVEKSKSEREFVFREEAGKHFYKEMVAGTFVFTSPMFESKDEAVEHLEDLTK